MMEAAHLRSVIFAAVMATAAAGLAQKQDAHDHGAKKKSEPGQTAEKVEKKDEHADHEEHAHEAPHGGTLVVLSSEFANLEFVIDSAKGKLTAYALDSHADKPVRLQQPEIEVAVRPEAEGATTITLRLQASASPLTGETVGNSSEFSAKSEKLKGVSKFTGLVKAVTIKGGEFKNVSFKFPEEHE